MQFEQSLMITGASIAGICFALAVTNPEKKYMYYGLGGSGLMLIAYAYLQVSI